YSAAVGGAGGLWLDGGTYAYPNTAYVTDVMIPSGNVGIGTTAPGSILELSTTSNPQLIFRDTGTSGNSTTAGFVSFYAKDSADNSDEFVRILGNVNTYTSTAEVGQINFQTMQAGTLSNAMIIQGGNVGIGTTNPTEKLSVEGNIRLNSVTSGYSDLTFTRADGWNSAIIRQNYSGTGAGGNLSFWTANNAGTVAEKMRIQQDGNVGIGTTAPNSNLNVVGAPTSGYLSIFEAKFGDTSTNGMGISIDKDATNGNALRIVRTDEGTWAGANLVELFDVRRDGNVGIGDGTPDAKLEVLGTTEQLRLTYTDGTVDSRFTVDASGNLTIDNTGTKTIIADDLQINGGDILDSNGNESIRFGTTASAVNEATLTNAATAGTVTLAATGGDTDIALSIDSKGADALNLNGTATGDILIGGGAGSTGCTIANATGTLTCTVGVTAGALKWNALTVPDGNLTLAMDADTTTFNWDTLTTGTGWTGASTSLSSGTLESLSVNSTAATGNTQKVLSLSTAGANAASTQTTYGLYATNTHTGTASTNVGGYFSASGGTNNYAAIFENGNVGIGTMAPVARLEVEDNSLLDSSIVTNGEFTSDTVGWTVPLSNATLASVAGGESGNALQISATTAYGLAYQAVTTVVGERYLVTIYHKNGTSSGLIKIGSTAPWAVGTEYYASGTINDADWTVRTVEFVATTTTTHIGLYTITSGGTSLYDTMSIKRVIGGSIIANGNIAAHGLFTGSGSNGLKIDNSGNVGIGTTAPGSMLDVQNSVSATGIQTVLKLRPYGYADGDGSAIMFRTSSTDGYGPMIAGVRDASGALGSLRFLTGTNAQQERMRITDGGNVGIGTTSPSQKLQIVVSNAVTENVNYAVNGTIAGAPSFVTSGGRFSNTSTGTGTAYGVFGESTGAGTQNIAGYFNASGATTNFGLYSAGGTNYMAGNVGIGTTSPTSKLSVGASSEFQVNSTGNIVKLNNVTTSFPSSQGAANSLLVNNG
ncbi:MAG: hypothetical protein NUV80_07200, partial [Candidatus Berkelbacteria bacterium]|nr:hypothetical protein [Candidatus Berkelbacteria bacterium]